MVDCIQKVEETMQFEPGDMLLFKRTGETAIIVSKGENMPGQPNNDWVLWFGAGYLSRYTHMSDVRLRHPDVQVFNASR